MNSQEKMDYLQKSVLFNSLLAGDEIRYSDLLSYYIEEYNRNPFEQDCPEFGKNIIVYREKKHTDLWISSIEGENSSESCEMPQILVENKLKSLPIEQQLKDYTSLFVDEYIESFKNIIRKENPKWKSINSKRLFRNKDRIESNIGKLKFYLLSPMGGRNTTVTCDISKINGGKELKVNLTWIHLSYSKLGDNLLMLFEKITDPYSKSFLFDFANILRSISVLTDEWQKEINNRFILDVFSVPEIFKEVGLGDLHSKFRASQCAEQLALSLGAVIYSGTHKNLSDNTIIVNHAFSRKDSLFEVKKKITTNLTVIIQFQNKELRKGLVIKQGTARNYEEWLLNCWEIEGKTICFSIMDSSEELDDDRYNKYKVDEDDTFYYSKYQIDNDTTVSNIISLMVEHINDVPTTT